MKHLLIFTLACFLCACKNNEHKATEEPATVAMADTVPPPLGDAIEAPVPATEQTIPHTTIRIDFESADVIVDTSATGKVHITNAINNKEVTYSEEVSEGQVTIRSKGKKNVMTNPGGVTIHVPGNCSITGKIMSGDLRISHAPCRSANVEIMSGDVVVADAIISKGKLSTMSGDVSFTGRVDSGRIELSTMSGDVRLDVNEASSTRISTSSGSGTVVLNGEQSEGSMSKTLGAGKGYLSGTTMSGDAECRTGKYGK